MKRTTKTKNKALMLFILFKVIIQTENNHFLKAKNEIVIYLIKNDS